MFGISVLILLGFIYWTTVNFIDRQTEATLRAEIDSLAEHFEKSGMIGLVQVVAARSTPERRGDSIYVLADPGYNVLAGNLDAWPDVPEDADRRVRFDILREYEDRQEVHPVEAVPFVLPGQFRLLVGRDMYDRAAVGSLLMESLGWSVGITLVLGLAGGVFISRRMIARIEAINKTSGRIMQGDLKQRIALNGSGDEFDQLSANLNAMLDQIERLMDGIRDVTDNIAHDLRSPLTRMKARLEAVANSPSDDVDYAEVVERTIVEADDLLSVFNALLDIAEVESGTIRSQLQQLDLNDLLSEVAELFEPVVEDEGMKLVLNSSPGALVRGHRQLLLQAVSNLIDNAIKYASGGRTIVLESRRSGDTVELIVADDGMGIPEHAHERVLNRSIRLDPSRSTPGHGLGLSMVSAVAGLHKADLRLEDNNPGLRVVMALSRFKEHKAPARKAESEAKAA